MDVKGKDQTPKKFAKTHDAVRRLKERSDVRDALEQTTHRVRRSKVVIAKRDWAWLIGYVALMIACAALYYMLRFQVFGLPTIVTTLLRRASLGGLLILVAFTAERLINVFLLSGIKDEASRFNIRRALKFGIGVLVVAIVISVVFENWYTAVVSFGLVSLILGFALQTPITSLIGWMYLLVRTPYRVGDRIRMGDLAGDVIDVGYLDTTLWEFGGDYLSTDHPSGRIIRIPNANVLTTAVVNYSWPLFPYIWDEIRFQVAYQSDLQKITETMMRVVNEELGDEMEDRVQTYRELLEQTPVNHLEVGDHPAVIFRVSENTWIEAIVRYLVAPREAGRMKSRLIPRLLDELNEIPGAVMFPKADNR